MTLRSFFVAAVFLAALQVVAQTAPAVVPPYTLLDPLVFSDSKTVTKKDWPARRAEIVGLFEEDVYGKVPASAKGLPVRTKVEEQDDRALEGRAIRSQVTLYFSAQGEAGPKLHLLMYLPTQRRGKVPMVLGISFAGNQTIVKDAGILLHPTWNRPATPKNAPYTLGLPEEATRGAQTQQWQVEKVLARGYGIATFYYGDLDPDFKGGIASGVRPFFYEAGQTEPKADDWGAIGVWAWGLSRALDYLATEPRVDAAHVAVTGHSRLGKTVDWAVAQDLRFAALLSTEAGKGGQSLSRRLTGETVAHLAHSFPYWFCENYQQWADHDAEIPADGNLLLSLIAPRPLYVASAVEDLNSDPMGEFLSAASASRVYELLGKPGMIETAMPGVDVPTDPKRLVAYHVRSGKHDVTAYDWEQYLIFLDAHFGKK